MNKTELITDYLTSTDSDNLVTVWRDYCDAVNGWDCEIFSMDDFNEILHGFTPEEIANRIFYGDFNPNAEYFRFNGYANLQSIWRFELLDYIYIDEIADYCVTHDNDLYDDEIREILSDDENGEV